MPGFALRDGQCKITLVPVCFAEEIDFSDINVNRAYHKDDIAMSFPGGLTEWTTCPGNAGACACLDPNRTEFRSAVEWMPRLTYRSSDASVPCDEPGFRGEMSLKRRELTVTPAGSAPLTRILTTNERDQLRELVLAVPPKGASEETCSPCRESTLEVGFHTAKRRCCGTCNSDYQAAFDSVVTFLESLIPE